MRLIRKRTFREWAKVLTERGLTVEEFDLVAQVGNTVHVKGRPRPVASRIDVNNEDGIVTFTVGMVWVNGAGYAFPGYPPGSTRSFSFALGNPFDYLVYCYVPYAPVTDYRPTEIISPPETQDGYQVIRIDPNPGSESIDLEIISEDAVTPEYEFTPATIDASTGVTTNGWTRRALFRLIRNPETLLWSATIESQDPSELIAFNADFAPLNNQIEFTTSAGLV